MTLNLKAEARTKIGKVENLRKQGLFPAVYYGKKEAATPIQIKFGEFLKVWKEAGESSVISISVGKEKVDTLINDVQFDPLTGNPIHADFYVFEKGQKMEISIPLEFIGESPAVKLGAVLVKTLHEIKIKAEPSNLPHEIQVDISSLAEIGQNISASDIKLPAGVELMENPEEVVVSVAEAKEEVVEEAAPIDLTQIEVEKKGKEKEEGEAGSTEATPEAKS